MRRRMARDPYVYDLVLMLDPELEDDRREKILADTEAIILDHGGDIVDRHDWGVRQTTYEISKRKDQDYHLIQFHATNAGLAQLDHVLRITDGITRHRVIKLRPGTPGAPDLRATAAVGAEGGDEAVAADDA
jgi:small subunit ribosomal protein S6